MLLPFLQLFITHNDKTVAKMITFAASKYQQTIVMVTHDRQMAEYADRILTITDGSVTGGVGV